jgi:hypothetical protein
MATNGRMMNWIGFGRKRLWPRQDILIMAGVMARVRTPQLVHTSVERYYWIT